MKIGKHYIYLDKSNILFFVHWWINDNPIIIIGLITFFFGLLGSIPGNWYLLVPKWLNSIHVNISSELLSISFSILIIDAYNFYKKFKNEKYELRMLNERFEQFIFYLKKIIENYYIPPNNNPIDIIYEFRSSLARGDYKLLEGKEVDDFVLEIVDFIDLLYSDVSKYLFLLDNTRLIYGINELLTFSLILLSDLKIMLRNKNCHLTYSLRMFLMKFSDTHAVFLSAYNKYCIKS